MYTFQDFGGRVVGIGDRDGNCHDDNNDGADNDNVNKECQENVRLKAREREFVFKEDAANSQVILHNNPRPIFLSFHSFQITFRIKTVYFRGSYLAYHATV